MEYAQRTPQRIVIILQYNRLYWKPFVVSVSCLMYNEKKCFPFVMRDAGQKLNHTTIIITSLSSRVHGV